MPETPTWGLPYPEASTLITDSAAIVQTLAERIDTALSQVTASDSYTIPGTLVETFTASGTFTPPPGVTLVHVAVIGGGGKGGDLYTPSSGQVIPGGGGGGGGVRVFMSVPVSGPVAVTIGGSGTPSSFGALTAPAGQAALAHFPGRSPNTYADATVGSGARGPQPRDLRELAGHDGTMVNGTYYAGGGGPSRTLESPAEWQLPPLPGGAGGGGVGWAAGASNQNPPETNAAPGTAGTGGGGGGGNQYQGAGNRLGGLGGSGRVMVFTEQTYKSTRNVPAPVDPEIDAALNVAGVIVGLVAVDPADPQAPGIPDATLVAYPDAPQPTGRMLTVPVDPDDPDGPTVEVPELAWPVAGWTYHDGTWTPPPLGEDTP